MSRSLLAVPVAAIIISAFTILYNIHIIEYQHRAAIVGGSGENE